MQEWIQPEAFLNIIPKKDKLAEYYEVRVEFPLETGSTQAGKWLRFFFNE